MAKLPVTMTFSVTDLASKAIAEINQRLGQLDSAAGRFNKVLDTNKAKFSEFSKASEKISQSMMKVGGVLTAGITAPLAAMGYKAVTVGADFEKAMNNLGARTQASTGDLALMSAEARRIGLATTFGASEAVAAMTELGKAGFDTKEILAGTGAVLNLAAGEMIDTSRAATIVASTIGQFGLKASDAGRVVDVLGKSAGISQIEIEDLVNTFKYAAKPANDFGVSMERLGAITATLGKFGVKSETAGTALRSFFSTLTGDANKIEKLQKAGLSWNKVFTDRTLKTMLPIEQVLDNIKALKLTDAQFGGIFDKESAGNIKTLVDNTALLRDNIKETYASAGFEAGVAAAQTKGFWGEWERLKNAVNETYIAMSDGKDGPLATFTSLIEKVRDMVNWFNQLPQPVKNTVAIMAVLAGLVGPIVVGLGGILALLPAMAIGWSILTAAMVPIIGTTLLITAVIGALAVGFFQLYENWDDVVMSFNSGLDTIKDMTNDVIKLYNVVQRLAGLPEVKLFDLSENIPKALSGKNAFERMNPFGVDGFSPQGVLGGGGKPFEPSMLAAAAAGATKNEVFVKFAGYVPPGTTVTEGAQNSPNFTLDPGPVMKPNVGGRR